MTGEKGKQREIWMDKQTDLRKQTDGERQTSPSSDNNHLCPGLDYLILELIDS